MEHFSELFFLILFQGIFQIYCNEVSEQVISEFENQQACMEETKIAEVQTITVYKNDFPILSWGKNKVILADEYKSRINILNEKNKLEFCIMNISREDAGEYIWKDKDGKNYSILILNVWYGPTDVLFTPNMSESETFNERSSLAINCSAVCNPNCNIYWVKNKDIRISNSSTLMLGNLSKMDGGNYTCKATNVKNNNQNISTGLEIHVNYAANINMPLYGYKEVSEYSSINITCNVSSYPLSNISWYNENKEVNSIFRGKNKVVLNLINSTCDDSGMYKCSAYNGIGSTDNKNITVEVLCKPRFVGSYARHKIKKRVSASIGDEFNMKFTIKAHPRPYLLFNSSDIDINVTRVSDFMYEVMMGKTILSDSDFQEYFYIFGNNQGNVTIAIEVKKKKTIGYDLIVGAVVSILSLLSISILLFTVFRRLTHQKENLSLGNPEVIYVNADFEAAESISEISFEEAYVFQNRVREIELTAPECYENLAVTGGTTEYEEMKVKTDSEIEDSQTSDRSSDENSFDEVYVF